MRTIILLGTVMALAPCALGQISLAGSFTGLVSGGKVTISSGAGFASVSLYDNTRQRVDTATITLNASSQGSTTSTFGQVVSVALSSAGASGSFGGVAFSATRDPISGLYSRAVYSGTLVGGGYSLTTTLVISPSGQAELYYADTASSLTGGGVGTINASKIVAVPLVSGSTATLALNPNTGVASGTMTLSGSGGSGQLGFLYVEGRLPRMVNISTRGSVGNGRTLIAGFVTTHGAKIYLIRGVGPALAQYGVTNANADPVIGLYRGNTLIATNDNWSTDSRASEVPTVSAQVGAFPLISGSKDAAMLVTLEEGVYSVIVSSTAVEGDALVEIYEVL
jgi:hypothetical protein